MRVEFFHAGMKARCADGGGWRLWGDNTADGGWRNRGGVGGYAAVDMFQCVAVWSSEGLPSTYTYSLPHEYWIVTRTKFDLRRTFRNVTTAQIGEHPHTFQKYEY
jgi:hypothetical protein